VAISGAPAVVANTDLPIGRPFWTLTSATDRDANSRSLSLTVFAAGSPRSKVVESAVVSATCTRCFVALVNADRLRPLGDARVIGGIS
jgi:hypothetical protein